MKIFEIKSGLRQSNALTPIERVLRTTKERQKMQIEIILTYADDVVVLENFRNEVTNHICII